MTQLMPTQVVLSLLIGVVVLTPAKGEEQLQDHVDRIAKEVGETIGIELKEQVAAERISRDEYQKILRSQVEILFPKKRHGGLVRSMQLLGLFDDNFDLEALLDLTAIPARATYNPDTKALQFLPSSSKSVSDEQYLKVGIDALRWMIGRDFREAKVIGFDQRPSGVVFYDFQLYVAGLKHLPAGSEDRKAATAQIAKALQWMAENQRGRGGDPAWSYRDDGHTDMAALPFLMYAFADQMPEHRDLIPEADRELRYIASLILEHGEPKLSHLKVWELMSWGMMSYAERLSPGSLFRSSGR